MGDFNRGPVGLSRYCPQDQDFGPELQPVAGDRRDASRWIMGGGAAARGPRPAAARWWLVGRPALSRCLQAPVKGAPSAAVAPKAPASRSAGNRAWAAWR